MNKTPEQKARDNTDRMLERSRWAVVDKNVINWSLGSGVAVREYQTDVGTAADRKKPRSRKTKKK